jgi:hypothetical protein
MIPAIGLAREDSRLSSWRIDLEAKPYFHCASELGKFFIELSGVLLEQGITSNEFADLVNYSLVRAAANRSKLRNGRVNYSRVAAQTGLSRAAVRQLLSGVYPKPGLIERAPLMRVVRGWRSDGQFLQRDGRPRRLRIAGQVGSFGQLVKKHGGDIPPRAILEELRRTGAVSTDGPSVRLRISRFHSGRSDVKDLKRLLLLLTRNVLSWRKNT